MHNQDAVPRVRSESKPAPFSEEAFKREWDALPWEKQDGADECHRAHWQVMHYRKNGEKRPPFDTLSSEERIAWVSVYVAAVGKRERALRSEALLSGK